MVRNFTKKHKSNIAKAVAEAEKKTGAEIVVAVTNQSSRYDDFVLAYSFALSILVSFALWRTRILCCLPWLLAVQIAIMVLFRIPIFGKIWHPFIPKKLKADRAARNAYQEYFLITRHLKSTIPVVVLFISRAERFVRIMPNSLVRDKISDQKWAGIMGNFLKIVRSQNLEAAIIAAVNDIAGITKTKFKPGKKNKNSVSNKVR